MEDMDTFLIYVSLITSNTYIFYYLFMMERIVQNNIDFLEFNGTNTRSVYANVTYVAYWHTRSVVHAIESV